MLKIISTLDGSNSLSDESLQETYHSVNGAVQESYHVYIQHGFARALNQKKNITVFEMGFGTGLNALLTAVNMPKEQHVNYYTVEAFPVDPEVLKQLNYNRLEKVPGFYHHIVNQPFNVWKNLLPGFTLFKHHTDFLTAGFPQQFADVLYYDAFGPKIQPELWELPAVQKCYDILAKNGILVTYCAQGQFKRHLKTAGFEVQELDGPPGKRQMTRAIKI